jgi:hypothetical protein
LLGELTKAGAACEAYKMLLNTEKPGWLYEVTHGATTIWETWEGYTGRGDCVYFFRRNAVSVEKKGVGIV